MLTFDFSNFPLLTTERLILRPLTYQDAKQIHELRSDPAVNALVGRTTSTGISDAIEFIKRIDELIKNNQGIYWAITLKGGSNLIGTICYWNFDMENDLVEIGYELLPEFQGKGYMKEVIMRVVEYGFIEMRVKTITAFPSANNTRSIAILEKMKFKTDNEVYSNIHENVNDMVIYTLKKQDY